MTNNSGTLYVGVSNNLERRVWEHKLGVTAGFTKRYKLTRLLYLETYSDIRDAIAREKQSKGWLRSKKLELIRSANPVWRDLSEGWYAIEADIETPSTDDQILRSAQNDTGGNDAVCLKQPVAGGTPKVPTRLL
jgi:putative endonuclease